jgi:hypothetical protein
MDLSGLGRDTAAGSYEHANETLDSVEGVSNGQLLNEDA